MTEITFEDPPKDRLGRGAGGIGHAAVAAALRERPGEWAVVSEYANQGTASSIACHIKKARGLKAYAPEGAYEAMSRSVDLMEDGVRVRHYRVYARYVGEAETDE